MEVFADEGETVLTDTVFPQTPYTKIKVVIQGAPIKIISLALADVEALARQHDEAARQYDAGLIAKTALLSSTIAYETSRRALTDASADRSTKAAALYRAEGF